MDELIAESMRSYLGSHREAMSEQFVREDVEWGLGYQDSPVRFC
ncbi:hypothetical protein [Methylomonas methanica]|nr:hypothetical protein [Methylomonas methanica]